MVPIRDRQARNHTLAILPAELTIVDQTGTGGLPVLWGSLLKIADAPFVVTLQIHNSAGIPIIAGQAAVAAGDQIVRFENLAPIGIDAYAHKTLAERIQIAERIWTRRTYGTFTPQR